MSLSVLPEPGPDPRSPLEPWAYSPEQAAKLIGVSRQHIYGLMKRGELASHKVGRSRRITAEALRALIGGGPVGAA